LDLLIFTIDAMLWRPDYMPNYGIGLPQMDLDAPRLLAHTHLFEIDALFEGRPSIDFARYMDDLDFGVDSIAAAKAVLRDLDLALQTRNLRLNSGKTKILTAAEARVHFRADDNALVDKLQARIIDSSGDETKGRVYARLIARAIHRGIATKRFDVGNGDKVLKRLLGTAMGLGSNISKAAFRNILYNRPGLRQILVRYWSSGPVFASMVPQIIGFLLSGEAVDDYSRILIARGLVDAQPSTPLSQVEWKDILSGFDRKDPYQLCCRLWMISRYGSVHDLKAEIDATNLIWSRHNFLCRLVAGFYGLFLFTPHFVAFEAYVRRWGGPSAAAILDFHEQIYADPSGYKAIRSFIKSQNSSLANKISHGKSLMLATMLWNSKVPKLQRAQLLGHHGNMMKDIYYSSVFSNIITLAA
jgi:hypothetical protein